MTRPDEGLRLLEELLAKRRPDAGADPRLCRTEGHRYQVHGKANPTKLACTRCRVTWAIGPRTEPSS